MGGVQLFDLSLINLRASCAMLRGLNIACATQSGLCQTTLAQLREAALKRGWHPNCNGSPAS